MYDLIEIDKWRFERKFTLSELDQHELESVVKMHPAIFSEIFHQRTINNIYLDSCGYRNYWENIIGRSQRIKVRIRWYGETFGYVEKPVLEIKTKNGTLGGKLSFKLPPFLIDNNFNINHFHNVFKDLDIHPILKPDILNLNFALMNKYNRKYFQSSDKKFRITIDSNIKYIKVNRDHNFFLNNFTDYYHAVLELKYDEQYDDDANKISEWFRFRMTKNSKYVNGLDNLVFR